MADLNLRVGPPRTVLDGIEEIALMGVAIAIAAFLEWRRPGVLLWLAAGAVLPALALLGGTAPHMKTAPVIVVCCARIHSHVSGSGRPSHPMDLAAATQTMAIAAADLGVHTSWIFGFRESDVRPAVGIPDDVPILGLLGLGYPDGLADLPERRPRDEVIAWDAWRTRDARTSLP